MLQQGYYIFCSFSLLHYPSTAHIYFLTASLCTFVFWILSKPHAPVPSPALLDSLSKPLSQLSQPHLFLLEKAARPCLVPLILSPNVLCWFNNWEVGRFGWKTRRRGRCFPLLNAYFQLFIFDYISLLTFSLEKNQATSVGGQPFRQGKTIQHVEQTTCRQFQLSCHHPRIKWFSVVDGAVAPQCPQDSRAACQQAAESRDNAVLAGSCQVILMAAVCCSYYSELYGLTVSHAKPVINTE